MTAGPTESEPRPLRWWERPRRLRRQLAGTLVIVAFVSVAIVGGLNYYAASNLLDDGTRESLAGIGQAQARTIEDGTERLLSSVSAVAADLAVVQSLESLAEEFDSLAGEPLDRSQEADLEAFYEQEVITPLEEAGIGPVELDQVLPRSDQGRYLQYHYTQVADAAGAEARRDVDDAGDGSSYSEVHREVHPYLSGLATTIGASDLLLISDQGEIVYSVEKRIDLGTDLDTGPYAASELAEAVDELVRVRTGRSVLGDYQIWFPGGGRPRLFAVAAVRNDTEIVGSIAVQIPIEALNAITAADGRWEEVGLGGGESYVVGSDLVLRSESRYWLEDPEDYLGRVDDDLAGAIRTFGSPVDLQPVDTEPARAALDGETFEGRARNYLGRRTFTYATPIEVPGVEWLVVADFPLRETQQPLFDFLLRLGIVVLVILPAAAIIGSLLARRLTRPIPPVVDAAAAIAAGDRDVELPELGHDEFGDLARRLQNMSGELARQEEALAEETRNVRDMLLTVLPPRLVDEEGRLVGTGDVVDRATVVAIWTEFDSTNLSGDGDVVDLLGEIGRRVESLAAAHGLERVRVAADSYLYLGGIGTPDEGADAALAFATRLIEEIGDLAETEELPVTLHVGLSTGDVATGMLQRGSLTFAAWGAPVRRALAISAFRSSEPILLDDTAAAAATDRWDLVPLSEQYDLDGQMIALHAARPRRERDAGDDADDG